jgi:hypothetical protein
VKDDPKDKPQPVPPDKGPRPPMEIPPDQPGLPADDPDPQPKGDPKPNEPTRLVRSFVPLQHGGGARRHLLWNK